MLFRSPTVHEGATVRAMEKKGIRTEKGEFNRWIRATNAVIRDIKKKIALLFDWIAEAKAELAKPQAPDLVSLLNAYYTQRRAGAVSYTHLMVKPDTEKPAELNIEKSNTEKSITYGSSTDSIPFRETAAERPPERKGRDAMSVTEIENYRELILENIEYDCLKRRYPLYRDDLNEIVELLVETVCARRKTTRISGADFPHEIVRSRKSIEWCY